MAALHFGLRAFFLLFVLSLLSAGCADRGDTVVVYTSLDRDISQPVLERIAESTGIRVLPQFDSESTKTTGLFQRLLAERSRPQADVFWNSEIARTIQLASAGVLERYVSPESMAYPETFRDPDGYWAGFAGRARVIVYNTKLVDAQSIPRSVRDLLNPRWKGKIGVAKPFFGTTATHVGAMCVWDGPSAPVDYFRKLAANDARFLPGNSTVRDLVANGTLAMGLTDTDDVWGALDDGMPVAMIYPDTDDRGTLMIPNTVALVRGGPNPDGGKRIIDALLSVETEALLAQARGRQIPLRMDSADELAAQAYRPVDFKRLAEVLPDTLESLKPLFP